MAQKLESEAPKIGVQATALVTAAFLSGAMASLSAIVIPVLLDTSTESTQLIRQWARLYHYGHMYMPAVSVSATGLYVYVALRKKASDDKKWFRYAMAGATTITMVPFTWIMMNPTNDRLFGLKALSEGTGNANANATTMALALGSTPVVDLSTVQELVVKWAWLHAVRSVFPLVGAILGLVAVLLELGL